MYNFLETKANFLMVYIKEVLYVLGLKNYEGNIRHSNVSL